MTKAEDKLTSLDDEIISPNGPEGGEAHESESALALILRTFLENKLAIIGLALVVGMAIFCFIGPLLYHTNQVSTTYAVNLPPGKGHPLGTDENGRDVLGRLMVGGQSSLEIGLAVAIIATLFGVIWGAIAGYVGGKVDSVMMRIVDVFLSIPSLFLLIFLAAAFTPNIVILVLIDGKRRN